LAGTEDDENKDSEVETDEATAADD